MRIKSYFLGGFLMIGSIWGGSYFLHKYALTWIQFPIFTTSIFIFLVGLAIFVMSCSNDMGDYLNTSTNKNNP